MNSYRIFCLYASLKESEPSPWLIAAEDEYSWEGDPERCERVFQTARDLAERSNWDVREITILADIEQIIKAFEPIDVSSEVESQ